MKKILLHGPAIDAAGQFVDAGGELTVAETGKPGTISAEEAKHLVDRHRAVTAAGGAAEVEQGDGLDRKKPEQLRKIADREGVAYAPRTRKADLLAAIRGHRAAVAAAAGTPAPEGGTVKVEEKADGSGDVIKVDPAGAGSTLGEEQ